MKQPNLNQYVFSISKFNVFSFNVQVKLIWCTETVVR